VEVDEDRSPDRQWMTHDEVGNHGHHGTDYRRTERQPISDGSTDGAGGTNLSRFRKCEKSGVYEAEVVMSS
jgi:hypothetical protein